eukprot:5117139-Pleurochrysis_carterae.AAC.5
MDRLREVLATCTSTHLRTRLGLYLTLTEHHPTSQILRIAQVRPPFPTLLALFKYLFAYLLYLCLCASSGQLSESTRNIVRLITSLKQHGCACIIENVRATSDVFGPLPTPFCFCLLMLCAMRRPRAKTI